jgi:D-glycerate 3-kinase
VVGTHDLSLASALFASLRASQPTKIPQYDKSAFAGQGDRLPESAWPAVNQAGQRPVQLVILEGWAVGFRALGAVAVEGKRRQSLPNQESTLWKNRLEDLVFVDDQLKGYDVITDRFDVFIHLDAGDTTYVYAWRQEQEAALRALRGVANAMTVEQVVKFVDNYYPAYELYTDGLRSGLFMGQPDKAGKQLRLVIAKNRSVIGVEQI